MLKFGSFSTLAPILGLLLFLFMLLTLEEKNDINRIYAVTGALASVAFLAGKSSLLKLLHWYEDQNYDAFSWLIVRFTIAFSLLYFYPQVGTNPLLEPLSFLQLVPFMHETLLNPYLQHVVYLLAVVAAVFFILNKHLRLVMPFLCFVYITNSALGMSYGSYGHASYMLSQMLLLITVFIYVQPSKYSIGKLFFLLYGLIGFYYFLPFLAKAYNEPWFGWVNENSLRLWIIGKLYDTYGYTGDFQPNILQSILLKYPLVALISSAIAFLTEGLGSLILFVKSHIVKLLMLVSFIALHGMIALTMDIQFYENIVILSGFMAVEMLILVRQFTKQKQPRQISTN